MFENELINQGLSIAAMGMGTVITFLCILIVAMFFMSLVVGILNKIFPVAVAQVTQVKKAISNDDAIIAAVIAAAQRF